eukprot:TRINITY_DN30721_c0_g1_i1.p1 TRINITY_DN30721_c0_g1~~TRINITY_DN30721_c0_g1_i1.p1  ORF type:complete len:176 (+),score=76.24 TRINITY_DN30721_c0_g1_i1:91-618(+)
MDSKTLYLQKHAIPELVDSLINRLLDDEPSDPKKFLHKCLTADIADRMNEQRAYCVQMAADVDAHDLFEKLCPFDSTLIGTLHERPMLNITERLVSRQLRSYDSRFSYALQPNSLNIRGFEATMKVLHPTSKETPACFVVWTATWDQAGELDTLNLPTYMKSQIMKAISECRKDG